MVDANGTRLWTVGEVAGMLRVHADTVRKWSNLGMLKGYRLGDRGPRRFSRQSIEDFVRQARDWGQASPALGATAAGTSS